jgi:hypothetical protein
MEPESAMVDEKSGLAEAWLSCRPSQSGRVKLILGWGERRWHRIGVVYASDICQFHDNLLHRDVMSAAVLRV